MLLKTQGIVLRSIKYGETSLILDVYTRANGRQSYMVNGVRSANARIKQSVVGVSSLLDMVVYHRDNKDIQRIKEIKPLLNYQGIPFDVTKGTVALFMSELISKTVKESEENDLLFDFLKQSFIALDKAEKPTLFPLVFPIWLATYIGFAPGNDWTENTPYFNMQEGLFVEDPPLLHGLGTEISRVLSDIRLLDISNMENIRIPKQIRRELLDSLIEYYKLHVENFNHLNSHVILREVF